MQFSPDSGQFRARFFGNAVEPLGAAIPIAAVAQIALHLVQHGVKPGGGGVAFVLLDELMCGVPVVGQGQFNSFKQILFGRAHGLVLPPNRRSGKAVEVPVVS